MERLRKVKMNYVKPVTSRFEMDKSICEGCMDIEQIFNGSGRIPTGMNIKFNIQCGEGGYDAIKENLHAVVEIQGDGVTEYRLESGGNWATCNVTGWGGSGLCEYQLDGRGECSYTSPLQVKRNGVWETVNIDWYGPKKTGSGWNQTITWVPYTE